MIGITRVRNEALILEDTISHVLGRVDSVVLYDDCSTDKTVEIAKSFDRVEVICGQEWLRDRPAEETRHRNLLLKRASALGAEWCLCFDADERFVGDFPSLVGDAYRFRLFDGYLTKGFCDPYLGGELEFLPRLWGPEYRDILMLFRVAVSSYRGIDKREPIVAGRVNLARTRVKHFGKCLSVDHWEETCRYYAENWPEPYKSKWAARRGKAIHAKSDFGRDLYGWQALEPNAVRL